MLDSILADVYVLHLRFQLNSGRVSIPKYNKL